jgi:WD40 repeat protein
MPMWIRCPQCDVAFPVRDESPGAEVRCDACGTRLGSVGDGDLHVERPIGTRHQTTLQGHTRDVWSVAFSLDGRTLASGSVDRTIRLWDPVTGEIRATLEGHEGSVLAVAFSPDGGTLASGSRDNTVKLWEIGAQTPRATLRGYTDSSLAFSPDGRRLASGGRDDTVNLWEVESGKLLETARVHRNSVHAVAFSPDGQRMALGHAVGSGITVQVWALTGGRAPLAFEGPPDVTAVCFSPDGKLLAAAGLSGPVKLWDPASGEERAPLTPLGRNQYFLPSAILSIAFSPDGSLLAMGLHLQNGPNVQLWDAAAGDARALLEGHRNSVQSVAFSPDGATLATASRDKTIRLWRITGAIGSR